MTASGRRTAAGCAPAAASARICASSGACPSAAAAAARSTPAAAVAGCPASSCAWACRHQAYPARCGQPRPSQVLAAALHAAGSLSPGQPGALGVPGGADGRDRGHERMVGERGTAHPAHPRDQAVGGGQRGADCLLIQPRSGLLGQVGAGAHARRQQPPAEYLQACGSDQGKDALGLLEGVAGPACPQRELRGLPRRLTVKFDAASVTDDGVDLLAPPGRRLEVAAQQVDLGAALMRDPVIAVWRPSGQRVDQCRCIGRAPAGQQRLGCVGGQEGGRKPGLQAGLASSPEPAQCDIGDVLELPES